ncbi:cysteine dioxygenase [Paraburkholderia xenovorans]|uniref:cysteine dioxygenase family protein n=1 Tax=Paraburkholderia xenovorans TaxID=36873 RepID=UPI0015C53A7D|nr:cysteine dioxygenase [Paraburkholderia xenovorans]NPT39552.1 cysteine dioxygenase [Paraburkholderia xenovorans]
MTRNIVAERTEAVRLALEVVRRIVGKQGIDRNSLVRIASEIGALATQTELFSAEDFPPPERGGPHTSTRYRLNAGDESGLAFYLNSILPGKTSIPHNHDTWAVVVAIEGEELNRVYERTDDRSDPDHAQIRVAREVVVRPGEPIAFLPDDIHSIHVAGERSTRHFHLYGRALELLTDRIGIEPDTGRIVRYNATHMNRNTRPAPV